MIEAKSADWHYVCDYSELQAGVPHRCVPFDIPPVAVFLVEDGLFITADTCTHGEASLSAGDVEDGVVTCPWHDGKFCIKSGNALAFPATKPLAVYDTKVEDGQVLARERHADETKEVQRAE